MILLAVMGLPVIFSNSMLFMAEPVCLVCIAATSYNISNNPNEVAFFVQSAKKFSDKLFNLQYSFYQAGARSTYGLLARR